MIPDIEVFATEARELYERTRHIDRDSAIYEMTRALLSSYGKGGNAALAETDRLIQAKFPRKEVV